MLLNFEDLVEKAKVDLEVNPDNLVSASANTGIHMVFYAEQRFRWQEFRRQNEEKLERISRYLWYYYNGKATAQQLQVINKDKPFKLQLNTKQDVEKFIESDGLYQEQKRLVDKCDNVIKFLDEVIGAVRFRAQVVRNMIQEKVALE